MFDALAAFICDHAWSIFDITMCLGIGMGLFHAYLFVLQEGGGYGTYGRGISDSRDVARPLPVNRTKFAPPPQDSGDEFVTSAVLTAVGGVPKSSVLSDTADVGASVVDASASDQAVKVRAQA